MQFSTIFLAIAAACSAQSFTNSSGAGVGATNGTIVAPNNGTSGAGAGAVGTTTVFATRTVVVGSITVGVTVSIVAALPASAFTTLSATTTVVGGASTAAVVVVVPISAGSVVTGSPTTFAASGATVTAGVNTAGSGSGAAATKASGIPVVSKLPASSSGANKIVAGALGSMALIAALAL